MCRSEATGNERAGAVNNAIERGGNVLADTRPVDVLNRFLGSGKAAGQESPFDVHQTIEGVRNALPKSRPVDFLNGFLRCAEPAGKERSRGVQSHLQRAKNGVAHIRPADLLNGGLAALKQPRQEIARRIQRAGNARKDRAADAAPVDCLRAVFAAAKKPGQPRANVANAACDGSTHVAPAQPCDGLQTIGKQLAQAVAQRFQAVQQRRQHFAAQLAPVHVRQPIPDCADDFRQLGKQLRNAGKQPRCQRSHQLNARRYQLRQRADDAIQQSVHQLNRSFCKVAAAFRQEASQRRHQRSCQLGDGLHVCFDGVYKAFQQPHGGRQQLRQQPRQLARQCAHHLRHRLGHNGQCPLNQPNHVRQRAVHHAQKAVQYARQLLRRHAVLQCAGNVRHGCCCGIHQRLKSGNQRQPNGVFQPLAALLYALHTVVKGTHGCQRFVAENHAHLRCFCAHALEGCASCFNERIQFARTIPE